MEYSHCRGHPCSRYTDVYRHFVVNFLKQSNSSWLVVIYDTSIWWTIVTMARFKVSFISSTLFGTVSLIVSPSITEKLSSSSPYYSPRLIFRLRQTLNEYFCPLRGRMSFIHSPVLVPGNVPLVFPCRILRWRPCTNCRLGLFSRWCVLLNCCVSVSPATSRTRLSITSSACQTAPIRGEKLLKILFSRLYESVVIARLERTI